MKKRLLICLVLAVVLCMSVALVACNDIDADTLATMLENVRQLEQTRDAATTGNYELAAKTVIGDVSCNVQWSVEITSEGVTSGVSVGEVVDDFVTIQIDDETPVEVKYNLIATLVNAKGQAYKDKSGNPYQVSFEHSIPAYVVNTYEQYKAACAAKSSDTIRVVGYIIDIVSVSSGSSGKGSVYLQDAAGNGYYAYAPAETTSFKSDEELYAAFPIGSRVEVSGTCTNYNGQYEFNKSCSIKIKGQAKTADQLVVKDATDAWGKAANNQDTSLLDYQNTLVKLEGAKFTRKDGKYYYFMVNGIEYNLYYNTYFLSEDDANTLFAKFVVGKQATVTGLVSVYSKQYQIYATSVDAISNVTEATFTSAEKIAVEKKALAFPSKTLEVKSYDLATAGTSFTDVQITWSLDKEYTNAKIENNKLVISAQGTEDVVIKLTATLNVGAETTSDEASMELTIPKKVENELTLSVDTLKVKSQAYSAITDPVTVGEVSFVYTELGNYGSGIQMRTKNGVSSEIYNTTAMKPIKKIIITLTEGKTSNANTDCVTIMLGSSKDSLTETIKLSTVKDQAVYELTPTASTHTFVDIKHSMTYSLYVASITFEF